MLKIILSLISIIAVSEGVKIEATRILLYINPNKTENNFFSSPYNATLGSKDVDIGWLRDVNYQGSDRDFTIRLNIDYIGKYDDVNQPARTCMKPGTNTSILVQTLFQIMTTGNKIKDRCPVGTESPTKCPGYFTAEVPKTKDIHCNTQAVLIMTVTNHFEYWGLGTHGWREHKILRAVYSGQFTGC